MSVCPPIPSVYLSVVFPFIHEHCNVYSIILFNLLYKELSLILEIGH
jgi:hypothetical protein